MMFQRSVLLDKSVEERRIKANVVLSDDDDRSESKVLVQVEWERKELKLSEKGMICVKGIFEN